VRRGWIAAEAREVSKDQLVRLGCVGDALNGARSLLLHERHVPVSARF
jgi:hypothetical protein